VMIGSPAPGDCPPGGTNFGCCTTKCNATTGLCSS
jgi:hypothetical protein